MTSWSKEEMTDAELEVLSVLVELPRLFSSRKIINCLEHDDFNLRVFEIMGKKPACNWFNAANSKKKQEGLSCGAAIPIPTAVRIPIQIDDKRPPSPKRPLSRKRKVTQTVEDPKVSQKGKGVEELVDPQADRSLPGGIWDPSFILGHKIDFNFDVAEQKVMEKTSEQKMAENCLEFACLAAAAAWALAYAFNKGNLIAEVERLKTQLNEVNAVHAQCEQKHREAEKMISDGRALLENLQKACVELKETKDQLAADLEVSKKTISELTAERDALRQVVAEYKERQEEMYEAIILEHTRGFKKALRQVSYLLNLSTEGMNFDIYKDVYQGELVPLNTIPDGTFTGEELEAATVAVETTVEEVGATVSNEVSVTNIVHIK